MKILVIFTGGTIGSTKSHGYVSTDDSKRYLLIQQYLDRHPGKLTFETANPYTLLSENLSAKHWQLLGECLEENLQKAYDGIIITHGSDTLAYTAAALDLAFPDLITPVMVVASNRVLDDPLANGPDNFAAAVECIREKSHRGVYVPYRNQNGKMGLHRGAECLPHLPYSDDLFSLKDSRAATIKLPLPGENTPRVLRIFPYPGLQYPKALDEEYGAVLLDTYHSGTLCAENPGLMPFLCMAREKKIPVFVTGAGDGAVYASVRQWEKEDLVILPKASPIAMYVKLWMILSMTGDKEEVIRRMTDN